MDGCESAFEIYSGWKKWLSSQCRKSDKNWSNNYVQSTCTSSYHEENTCKVWKQLLQTVRGVALTRDTLCLYNQGEKWLSWQYRKSDKIWSNNYFQSTCTSSYHEENTCKVSNNGCKTVRGVALTRDTLCLYNQGEKWLSSQCRKSDKNWSNNYVQSTCTSSYHEENTCKVSKQWVQNCKRSCAHKIPMLTVDGWTDGRTYERMNVRTNERTEICTPMSSC